MTIFTKRRLSAVAAATAAATAVGGAAFGAAGAQTGPSSSQAPYLVRTTPGVVTTSLLTVGDSVGGYRMVGIPDGLGAYDNGDGTFTVLMNHELRPDRGAVRDHGARGAFVSTWVIDATTREVLSGDDLIKQVLTWSGGAYVPSSAPLNRLCSADLPVRTALFDPASGKGYEGRIFLSGEEAGAEGRAFAHVLDGGTSYELPALGKMSWENLLAHPSTGDRTVVVGTDDSTPGQVYVHVGQKSATGTPPQKAGLTGGTLYGVQLDGVRAENDGTATSGAFRLLDLGDATTKTGAQLETQSDTLGVTEWARPEDGAWDPNSPNDFYFVTTAGYTSVSRLWRLRFQDASRPELGGVATALVNGPAQGTDGPKMLDNMTVNDRGQVLMQEDPGNQARLAKIWQYDIASGALRTVAEHDPARFSGAAALTQDEESSGIIPAPFLGAGWYLADVQAHVAHPDPELVEHGQLLAIHIPPGQPVGRQR